MSLDWGAIRAALEARAATATGYPPLAQRARANTGFVRTIGTAHVLTDLRPVYTEPRTWPASSARLETRGLFTVDLYLPLAQGPATGDTLSQAVLAVFPYGLTLAVGAEILTVRRAVRAGGLHDDAWYHIPVTVTWDIWHLNTL